MVIFKKKLRNFQNDEMKKGDAFFDRQYKIIIFANISNMLWKGLVIDLGLFCLSFCVRLFVFAITIFDKNLAG